jgi:hypothetical protein
MFAIEKNRIKQSTKILICQNVGNWLNNEESLNAKIIAPGASKNLIKATIEQAQIGWEHWLMGCWSREWGAIINYDIKHNDSGIKYNLAEKLAKELLCLHGPTYMNVG